MVHHSIRLVKPFFLLESHEFYSKLGLEELYILWDLYIMEDDPNLFLFLGLALMTQNRENILQCEPCSIGQHINSLGIASTNHIKAIFSKYV